jgi:hypothetical protein
MLAFDKGGDGEHFGGSDNALPATPVDSDLKHVVLPLLRENGVVLLFAVSLAVLEEDLLDGCREKGE